MLAYKKIVTVEDPDRVVLSGLPFRRGQRVEVVMLAEEDEPRSAAEDLRGLLQATQALPAARDISDEEIAEEVVAYRAGR
ncbi:MAG: hypothetical protein HY900_13400 [Deltaproteobacteria bacterium]|nr:hypothetical protein [Deltaproteobacteria bacterium]